MMAGLVNFACWTPETVTATIATEAASPSDAVLLATHTPLGIRRRAESTAISETQFLHEFLDGPDKEGVRIAPVLGESGSGKSHLVRWVRAKMPNKQGRHVIYLEKAHTSLRDVIESLLLGQTGPNFDEIRAQLAGLRETVRQDQLERKILDELAGAVREAKVAPGDFLTKALVGDRGLYTLLHDLTFREYMLRPGSFVPKRAEHALRGRGLDDEDVPPTFTLSDLPLDIVNHANLGHANELARQMYKRLTSDPGMQAAALVLLNDNLDYAVMRAANLGVGSVHQTFMAIREHFVGQEIVLLIEDFVLIQGIRRDILDAIIEVGTIGGVERYATVRTLMAVTPGYYDSLPDTFRTRVEASSPIYEVDVRLDDKAVGGKTVVDFVGRYLNAARLGASRLEEATEPLNACEACPVMDECHAAFGVSRDGFGLYPYNDGAIDRGVQLTADPRNPSLLNPRRVLSRMIRGVLINEAGAIEAGEFPSPDFLGEDRARDAAQTVASKRLRDLPLDLREALHERYDEPEYSRYVTAFQFWGGASVRVKPGVLAAFSIPPVDINSPSPDPESGPDPTPGPTPRPGIPPSLQQKLQRIDDWSKNSPLPQDEARAIRNIVRNVLLADLDLSDPIMKDLPAEVIRKGVPDGNQIQRVVSIEAAAGENLPEGVTPIVRFKRTPSNAKLFQSLLLFKETEGRSAPDALIRLRALGDAHRPEVIKRLVVAAEYENEGLVAAAASLIVGAALCGQLPPNPRAKDYLAAAVWSGGGYARPDKQRHQLWVQHETAYLDVRKEAVDSLRGALGPSQGVSGKVHALDDVRVRKIVQAAKEQLGSIGGNEMPAWCRTAEKSRQRLEDSIPVQVAEWKGVLQGLREQVPGDSFRATVDAVVAATTAGHTQGLVKANLAAVEEANKRARGLDFGAVYKLEAIVKSQEEADRVTRASLVGSANADDVVAIYRFLIGTSVWLDAGLKDARARVSSVVLDIDKQIEAALAAWGRVLDPKAGDQYGD